MSTDRKDRLKPPPDPTAYEVGYGKPPKASRFAPGQSGNLKGRPKGPLKKAHGPKEDQLREILLTEAYRPIKVSEGKRQIKVPIVTAVVRTLAVNAARGQPRAQHLFAKVLSEAEQALGRQKKQRLEQAVDYKVRWEVELERRKRLAIAGPEPVPHPDDVHIDLRTGEVHITGPMTREEKVELDRWYDRVEELDSNIERLTAQFQIIRIKKVRDYVEIQIADERALREAIVSKIGEPSKRRGS